MHVCVGRRVGDYINWEVYFVEIRSFFPVELDHFVALVPVVAYTGHRQSWVGSYSREWASKSTFMYARALKLCTVGILA